MKVQYFADTDTVYVLLNNNTIAETRDLNGIIRLAELHWYEAHGIGKKEFKRKRYLD